MNELETLPTLPQLQERRAALECERAIAVAGLRNLGGSMFGCRAPAATRRQRERIADIEFQISVVDDQIAEFGSIPTNRFPVEG